MALTDIQGYVDQASLGAASEGSAVGLKRSKAGALVVMDFYAQMVMEGRGFQVRIGTISVPTIGDVALTDASAEMCADASTGWTILPCYLNVSINLGTGTDQEIHLKSAAAISTAGTAFVPLPLYIGGAAAATTARAAAAGAVTVAAELATTTRRHFSHGNAVAVGAGNEPGSINWQPLRPPPIKGPGCIYLQAASTDAGPSYYASLDYIELPSVAI